VIVVLLLFQPFLGYIHHRRYLSTQRPTVWTHVHVWFGRVLILVGIINGGLGLKLASDTPAYSRAGTIAYSVLAGVMGTLLVAMVIRGKAKVAGKKTEAEG